MMNRTMQIRADVYDLPEDVTGDAVYADPPYKGQGHRYGRKGDVSIVDLIAVMEGVAPRRAMSISAPMLATVLPHLKDRPGFRVCPWVKPQTSFKPNVWPAYTWEPVLVWGEINLCRDMPTPRDHLVASAHQRKPGQFVTPKPPDFGDWIVRVLLPRPSGQVFVDLFAGSGAVGRVAEGLGCDVVWIDDGRAAASVTQER
jgi:hypothetical protein